MRSELAAAHAAAQTDKDYAAQRLADQQTHYEQLISELRTPHTSVSPTDDPAADQQHTVHHQRSPGSSRSKRTS